MRKSNGRFGYGRGGSGTVTVIEEPVLRSYRRKAKAVYIITWIAAGLLAFAVLDARLHFIAAALAGAAIGWIAGAAAGLVVTAWPVLRAIWWWLPEITAVAGTAIGWMELAAHAGLIIRVAVVVLVLGVPSAVRPLRRGVIALAWCQVSRHRVRSCFSEFIITNRYGTLPLILGARPTPAGERLWIWLRPGLSPQDVQDRAGKIAATCWAATVVIDQARASNSALLRLDIKRRDPLTGSVSSPLTAMAAGFTARRRPAPQAVPGALDLPDVAPADVTPAKPSRPQWPTAPAPAPAVKDTSLVPAADQDDITDWI